LTETRRQRRAAADAALVLDDTLCAQVGGLFAHIDRHYNPSAGTYPLAHNPVTSSCVGGPARFPVAVRLSRRYEELTHRAAFVSKHYPDRTLPTVAQGRAALRRMVGPTLLADREFRAVHDQVQTKIALGLDVGKRATQRVLPRGVVLMAGWYPAEGAVTTLADRKEDWGSLLRSDRTLETASFVLKDDAGQPTALAGPHRQVQTLVPLLPCRASRPVTGGARASCCFTLTVRVASLGKVRRVISFDAPDRTGRHALPVTNRTDRGALKISAPYLWRCPLETSYQDGKTLLGLAEYRMRSAEASATPGCLGCVAYSSLPLACLPPSLAEGVRPGKSLGAVCRDQAQALSHALTLKAHALLAQGQQAMTVFAILFAKLGWTPT
jgi:hypothetical protein